MTDSSGVKVSREMKNGKKIVIRIKDITNFSASMFVLVIFYSFFWGGKNILIFGLIQDYEVSLPKKKTDREL